jgi:hypothetical protein
VSDPDAPPLDADALIGALQRHKVSFVAVGGLAAQWQGAQRPTKDLDVCPAWDGENLERLAQALRDIGARLKVRAETTERLTIPVDGRLLSQMEITAWRTDADDLDILLGIPRDGRWDLARYEQLRENAILLEIGEHTVLVAALKDIIRSKEIADRPPDREALPELRRLRDDAVDSDAEQPTDAPPGD